MTVLLPWLFLCAGFVFILLVTNVRRHNKLVNATADRPDRFPQLGYYDKELDVSTGYHIFADGNMWCAVGPAFENLQESLAGFGPTPRDAYYSLLRANWAAKHLPRFAEFTIHQPTVKSDVH